MEKWKQKALESAGWAVGDAAEFLGLSAEEQAVVAFRLELARTVRQRRRESKLSQKDLAAKIGSSQSRVAKFEAGEGGVTLDLLIRALFASGGGWADILNTARTLAGEGQAGARRRKKETAAS